MNQPVCSTCHHVNTAGARFCSSCGLPLAVAAETAYPDGELGATMAVEAIHIDSSSESAPLVEGEPSAFSSTAPLDDELVSMAIERVGPGQGLLIIRRGLEDSSHVELGAEIVNIGRHPDSEVVLDDITVSRRHVQVEPSAEGYVASDMGSLNGTYVNRVRVERAVLGNGDELQVGKFKITFLTGSGE